MTAKKAIIETSQRKGYQYWAKLFDENGVVTEISAPTKIALINFLAGSGYALSIEVASDTAESRAEVALAKLIEAIPGSFTIDDDRMPEEYDDFDTVGPYIRGANGVIAQLRGCLSDMGYPHLDSKYRHAEPAPDRRNAPKLRRYLVGISYKDGSADNDFVEGFSAACEKAESASRSEDVQTTSIWSEWTPIRDYVNGEVVKEYNGEPAY